MNRGEGRVVVGGVCGVPTGNGKGGWGTRKKEGERGMRRRPRGAEEKEGVGSAVEATVRFTRNRPGLPVLTV